MTDAPANPNVSSFVDLEPPILTGVTVANLSPAPTLSPALQAAWQTHVREIEDDADNDLYAED
jgi:hypothetical protein